MFHIKWTVITDTNMKTLKTKILVMKPNKKYVTSKINTYYKILHSYIAVKLYTATNIDQTKYTCIFSIACLFQTYEKPTKTMWLQILTFILYLSCKIVIWYMQQIENV